MSEETTHPPAERELPQQRTCEREQCEQPVPESLGTKPKRYCSRTCRQRAYEERRLERLLDEARVAARAAEAVAWARQANVIGGTSHDVAARSGGTSHDVLRTSHDDARQPVATSHDDAQRSVPAPAPRPRREAPFRPVIGGVMLPFPEE